ncbi:chemotaxis protein CheB [Methyloversatilis sp.]|uniref:chemotaxis protein CheB n=1 Tax=Methyloversatilis sp. TaxID=2569862 RepID=UPI00301446CE
MWCPDSPPANRHKPPVDVPFRSAADCRNRDAVGMTLTGMGDDVACGMKQLAAQGKSGKVELRFEKEACLKTRAWKQWKGFSPACYGGYAGFGQRSTPERSAQSAREWHADECNECN